MKKPIVASLLALAMLGAGTLRATDGQPQTMLVLDASGSMWGQIGGQPKITIARQAIGAMLDDWSGGDLGLMAYGHRRKGDCADIEVLLSFYDYPNFRDTRTGVLGLVFCTPLWNDLGQSTPSQLNAAAIEFVDAFASVAAADPRIHHVRHFGLMQHHYGIDAIPAGQLALPGDATLPSPLAAMRDRGIGRDCFHLGPEGYDHLVQNLYDGYYRERFDVSLFGDSFESALP